MAPESVTVLTIDGPSGSGKGTVGLRIARRLGWHFLDSGALYRALALWALRRSVAVDDEAALAGLASTLPVDFVQASGADEVRVLLGGEDVGAELRTEACAELASRLASLGGVRAALLERQRSFRCPPGLVADGRDMGTVVFPDAVLKIFLTASAEERARRRHKQLKEKGLDVNLPGLIEEVRARDQRDATRGVAPLRAASDALTLDTTELAIEQVVAAILERLDRTLRRPAED